VLESFKSGNEQHPWLGEGKIVEKGGASMSDACTMRLYRIQLFRGAGDSIYFITGFRFEVIFHPFKDCCQLGG
jgi:hypothetical protein